MKKTVSLMFLLIVHQSSLYAACTGVITLNWYEEREAKKAKKKNERDKNNQPVLDINPQLGLEIKPDPENLQLTIIQEIPVSQEQLSWYRQTTIGRWTHEHPYTTKAITLIASVTVGAYIVSQIKQMIGPFDSPFTEELMEATKAFAGIPDSSSTKSKTVTTQTSDQPQIFDDYHQNK